MKRLTIVVMIAIGALAFGGCSKTNKGDQATKSAMDQNHDSMSGMQHDMKKDNEQSMEMEVSEAHAMVMLPTIQCDNCKQTIESGLAKVDGILAVSVDVAGKMAHINYDSEKISAMDVDHAIAKLGYQANKMKADPEAYAALPACCKVQ